MACSDPQQRNRRSLRSASPLLPIAKRMNADPHRPGELSLRKPSETTKRSNVIARLEASCHEPSTQPSWDRAGKLPLGQFRNVSH
jgi:hypothetical protein